MTSTPLTQPRRPYVALVMFLLVLSVASVFFFNHVQQQIKSCPKDQESTCEAEKSPSVTIERKTAAYTADLAEITAVLVLATAILAVFTYRLWNETERLANDAKVSAETTATKMQAAVDESKRSADEMGKIAIAVADNGRAAMESVKTMRDLVGAQSRAYVGVLVGGAIYQEREKGLRFEADPVLTNIGHTPARKITDRIAADILPIPIPENFAYPLPTTAPQSDLVAWPQQRFDLSAVVRDYVDEQDVPNIKRAMGRGLCVWGTVTYEDTFGVGHYTNFCHILTWRADNSVYGLTTFKHNDAD